MKRMICFLGLVLACRFYSDAQIMKYAPGEALVRFRKDVSSNLVFAASAEGVSASDPKVDNLLHRLMIYRVRPLHPYSRGEAFSRSLGLDREFVLDFSPTIDVDQAVRLLREDQTIEIAEPNRLSRVESDPHDPYFTSQYALEKIGMKAAWNITHGSLHIRVAILDVGFKLDHADLGAKFSNSDRKDFVDLTQNELPQWRRISGEDYTTVDDDPTTGWPLTGAKWQAFVGQQLTIMLGSPQWVGE